MTNDGAQTRHALLSRLADARCQTDRLFDLVRPDSLYERPVPERHRIIFYLGHLEAFDWNLLSTRLPNSKPFNPGFDRLFAFGIDPLGGGLPSDKPGDWPHATEVVGYANQVRQTLDTGLAANDWLHGEPEDFPDSLLLNVAIEHRLMHAETFTYMLHQLPIDRKICRGPRSRSRSTTEFAAGRRMIDIPGGQVTLGLTRDSGTFGWDNEHNAQAVTVPPFAIDEHMVTNRQYLQFITAGGYENQSLWTEADWQWRTGKDISHPAFWRRTGDSWSYRAMFDEGALPMDWPVYVSHAEASAYAHWARKSLPTEAEWHRAAFGSADGQEHSYPWATETSGQSPNHENGNFDFHEWDPAPVNAFPQGRSAFGVAGLLGNGWEWTSSRFEPFAGFQPFPFYPGYSADFFDGKHYVIKGGSARTAACMLRRSFRNWFQPHYQYAYAGFRCVSR